jgi:phage shock protein A
MSKPESIQNVNDDVKKWDWAIAEAQSLLQKAESRVARLKGAVKTFTELRDRQQTYDGPASSAEILSDPRAA